MTTTVYDYINNFKNFRGWDKIVIHHSQTKDDETVDWLQIKDYHTNVLGWQDIGYHFGLEFVQGKLTFQVGRPLDIQGAHCQGANYDAIGICLIGNYDLNPPIHQQYFLLASLCRELMTKYPIEIKNIHPHWVYSEQKTCPGRQFDMLKLRDYVKGIVPG